MVTNPGLADETPSACPTPAKATVSPYTYGTPEIYGAPELCDTPDEHGNPAEPGGVGPWPGGPQAWPDDPRLDPELLAAGDRRNVTDQYRYWSLPAIVADLDKHRHPLRVAIENLDHDFNIGSIVRSANAFGVHSVHIVGRRRWNRRGAMVTDRYQHICHHPAASGFLAWAQAEGLPVIGIDNLPGSVPLEKAQLPERCIMVFGSEAAGLSPTLLAGCEKVCHITQFGSTRSINVGAAAAVAMWAWVLQHGAL